MHRRLCGVALDRIRRIYQVFQAGYPSPMALLPDEIYSPEILSKIIDVSPRTLEKWRKNQTGPPCSKIPNGEIRYSGRDVIEWFEKRKLTVMDAER